MSAVAPGVRIDAGTPGILALHGVLDFATAEQALRGVRSALAGRSVAALDLSGVTHGDSAGLACLLAVMAEASARGQDLRLQHLPEHMRVLAEVCGAGPLLG